MSYGAGILLGKPRVQITGAAYVEMLSSKALKDVDVS